MISFVQRIMAKHYIMCYCIAIAIGPLLIFGWESGPVNQISLDYLLCYLVQKLSSVCTTEG